MVTVLLITWRLVNRHLQLRIKAIFHLERITCMDFNISNHHQTDGATIRSVPGLLTTETSRTSLLERALSIFQKISIRGVPVALRITSATIAWFFFFCLWWKVTRPGQVSP